MASSPETTPAPDGVRWPWVARIGLVIAVLTLVGGLAAALVAAFVIDRSDDPAPAGEDLGAPVDEYRTGVRYWVDGPVGDAQSTR